MSEAQPPRASASFWLTRLGGPLFWVAALLWAYWDLWFWDPAARHHQVNPATETFFFSAQATSPPLVFGLVVWLLWRRRTALGAAFEAGGRPLAGAFVLLAGLGFGAWAHMVDGIHLFVPSLSLMLLGAALSCGGLAGLRAMALPAGFVLFASPLPSVLVNSVVFPLQLWTGEMSAYVANALGKSNMVYGDLIATDTEMFQVIEACSGLRTIVTLTMAALLYGEGFSKTLRRTAALVALVPVLAMVANVVRVTSIVLNPLSEFAEVHTLQGMVTIFGGVLLLGLADFLMSRVWGSGVATEPPVDRGTLLPPVAVRFALPTLALLALAIVTATATPWKPIKSTQTPVWKLARSLPDSRDLRIDGQFLGSVGFSHRFLRRFEREDGNVHLFVGSDQRTRGTRSLFSGKTLIPESGFFVRERRQVTLEPGGQSVEEAVLDSRSNSVLAMHWRIDLDSPAAETLRAWLEIGRSPLHNGRRSAVVRVTTRIARRPSGREQAETRLRDFIQEIAPTLEEFELL